MTAWSFTDNALCDCQYCCIVLSGHCSDAQDRLLWRDTSLARCELVSTEDLSIIVHTSMKLQDFTCTLTGGCGRFGRAATWLWMILCPDSQEMSTVSFSSPCVTPLFWRKPYWTILLSFSNTFGTCHSFAELSSDLCALGYLWAWTCKVTSICPAKLEFWICAHQSLQWLHMHNGTEAQDSCKAGW